MLILLSGCSEDERKLEDFICKTLHSYRCPEGFECKDREYPRGMEVMDDAGDCVVAEDNVCDPDATDCPRGFLCEEGDGRPYCRPDSPCGTSERQCPEGKFCYAGYVGYMTSEHSAGYCYPIPGHHEAACPEGSCAAPLICAASRCLIQCGYNVNNTCPQGYECKGGYCDAE